MNILKLFQIIMYFEFLKPLYVSAFQTTSMHDFETPFLSKMIHAIASCNY